jgi:lipid II:glycine glycyltransferase (peptidoglycan interpeptide bridge formation enzyme)
MILEKSVGINKFPFKLSIQYIPRGPLLDWENTQLVQDVLEDIENYSQEKKVIFTKIDPEVLCGGGFESENFNKLYTGDLQIKNRLLQRKWNYSASQIQFENTVWIDLVQSEEQIQSKMKQKTRYNIRLSDKKGVKIRVATQNEFEKVYQLYAETSLRDNFVIRSKEYYLHLWKTFSEKNICEVLIAEYEDTIIAGLILYYFGDKAYYVYGMSANVHRNLMPTYLLQWEAILRAKQRGKKIYDLWGAPTNLLESDPMWGVYKFKLGLGGELVQTIGAWDFSSRKLLNYLYGIILPNSLKVLRIFGRKKTQVVIE